MASASDINYFDMWEQFIERGYRELMTDGSLIAEDPSLYATMVAQVLSNHSDVRVLSIGQGVQHFQDLDFGKGGLHIGLTVFNDYRDVIAYFNNVKASAHEYFTNISATEFLHCDVKLDKLVEEWDGSQMQDLRLIWGQRLYKEN